MFVIRDYKLNAKVRRPKGRGRLRVLAAAGLLATTLGAVRFLDLNTDTGSLISNAEAASPLTSHLAIPGKAGETGTLADPAPATLEELPVQQDPQPSLQVTRSEIAEAAVADPVAQPTAQGNPDQDAPSLLAELGPDQSAGQDNPEMTHAPSIIEFAAVRTQDLPGVNVTQIESVLGSGEQAPQWTEHKIARGESLARIFDSQGLDASLLHRIVNSGKQAKSLAKIRPGQKLRFQFDDNRELTGLELQRNRVECLRISIADDEIKTETISKEVDTQVASAAGVIESSLFMDGQKAGLSDGLIMELATIFGWDIDFALEIRAGDQFRVLYEEHYLDGEKLRDGPILAAEFTNRGTAYTAVRYEDSNGEVGYFDADGHSKRRAFIRSPIRFARVSSRYNPKRWHPVLKKWRSHKGVDYAAPRGTAVRATGDGRVIHRGTKGGYGRTVIVEHASKYTTLYAHLSKYSKRAKSGSRVKQGQVIGYVGKSGLATGPHLHYEFRVRGRHHDPLRVKLPKSLSLPKSEIANFRKTATPLLTQLAAIPADTMVASAGITETPLTARVALFVGVMSGTSMDAVDTALVELGGATPRLITTAKSSWPSALRERLQDLAGGASMDATGFALLDAEVGESLAAVINAMLNTAAIGPTQVTAIGCHGQTVAHTPDTRPRTTLQLGDANVVAERTGITTVNDFRRRDMAAGGQGAPLATAFHAAFLRDKSEDRIVLNLGGIANITILTADARQPAFGFDTGPANCLMDAWSRQQLGKDYDEGGAWAASAQADPGLLETLLDDSFFGQEPPKSTGTQHFSAGWLDAKLATIKDLPPACVQATLMALTCQSVADAVHGHAPNTKRVLVCGGGTRNGVLLQRLADVLGLRVESTADFGIDPDWMEAMAFAWLAQRTLAGEPGNLPAVTGAAGPRILGAIHPA